MAGGYSCNVDIALTRENLAYMGLYEPFYELYCSYTDILEKEIEKSEEKKKRIIWPDTVVKTSNKKVRLLFNDFLKEYLYIFADYGDEYHVNSLFMNRIDIMNINYTKFPTIEVFYDTFPVFLTKLEEAMASLIKNRKEKEDLRIFHEEDVLRDINNRIQNYVAYNKPQQFVDNNVMTAETEICKNLIVYNNLKTVSCNQKGHTIVSSSCYCKVMNNRIVCLPVHTCQICGKNFIGCETLKIYESLYGKMIVVRCHEGEGNFFDCLGESELYKTGYNAKEAGMTDAERKEHLRLLIETKRMSPFDIIRDLEDAIKKHSFKISDRFAVERWKKDLEYVNSFIAK